ncbi:MAG: hypothetical protein F6K55_23270 [Moorea sp. SIO4A3]|nr:hypothetical protein [Moorena sp. SIO4A3]
MEVGNRESGIGNRESGVGSGATRGEFNYGSSAPRESGELLLPTKIHISLIAPQVCI